MGVLSDNIAQGAFSVDVEEWYDAELPARILSSRNVDRGTLQSVTVEGTRKVLSLLRETGFKGTFFFVGEVMRRFPFLVQEVLQGGHELGCHGWTHRMLTTLKAQEFDADLKRFREFYNTLGFGQKIVGFRAPSFSLCPETIWALRVLEDNGFLYDSSVFPMRTPLYGVPGAPRTAYRPMPNDLRVHSGLSEGIVELPMPIWAPTQEWGVPVSGGFYLRVLPAWLFSSMLRRVARDPRNSLVLYIHSWEFAPTLQRVALPLAQRWITYTGIAGVERKVERLLKTFRWTSCYEFLGSRGMISNDEG